MKIFYIKFWETRGILELDAEKLSLYEDNTTYLNVNLKDRYVYGRLNIDSFESKEEAIKKVKVLKERQIKSLEKRIERIRNTNF